MLRRLCQDISKSSEDGPVQTSYEREATTLGGDIQLQQCVHGRIHSGRGVESYVGLDNGGGRDNDGPSDINSCSVGMACWT